MAFFTRIHFRGTQRLLIWYIQALRAINTANSEAVRPAVISGVQSSGPGKPEEKKRDGLEGKNIRAR